MSFLLLFDENKISDLISQLSKYEKLIEDAEPIFNLENRRLEEIMRTLPHYQSNYDQALQDVKAIEEWLNIIKDKITSKYWKKYLEVYPKQLSQRDIQAYIQGEKEIIEINQILIEITINKNKLSSIVEALKQMGWMMGHITKLRISEMQDAVF